MKSFSKLTFSIFKRDILLYFLSFITSVLIARKLGPSILGIVSIFKIIISYAEAFVRTKSDLASVYLIGKKKISLVDALSNLNLIAILSSSLLLSIIFFKFNFFYNLLFSQANGNYKIQFFLLLIISPLNFFYLNYSYIHITLSNIKVFNYMATINTLVNCFATLFFIYIYPINENSILIAHTLAPIFALFYGWYKLPNNLKNKGRANFNDSLKIIRYGMQFYVVNLFSEFQQSGSRLIAVAYLPVDLVGFLAQGERLSILLQQILSPVSTLLFPKVSFSNKKDGIKTCCFAFRVSLIIILVVLVFYLLFIKFIVLILFGNQFIDIAKVVYYLAPCTLITGLIGILNLYYASSGRVIIKAYIQIVPVLVLFILTYLLTKEYGLFGPLFATLANSTLYAFLSIIIFLRETKVNYLELIPMKSDFMFVFSFLKDTITQNK